MSRTVSLVASVIAMGAIIVVWSAPGHAGGEKSVAWKPFLPSDAAKELSQRSLKRIGELAKADGEIEPLRAEALILAAYTMTSKEKTEILQLQSGAVKLALAAGKKGNNDATRLAAAELVKGSGDKSDVKDWRLLIGDIKAVMTPFENKDKRGEGVHPDLHYSAKVKNQNGIEALINALAAKKLTDANVGKMSKELELLGYRVAAIGALTIASGPGEKKKADDEKAWNAEAVVMRDAAVELAEAARKKDGPAILEASKRLENTCVECHSNFK